MEKKSKFIPEVKGVLRSHVIEVPPIIRTCGGMKIFGKRIKSILFTTDVAIIRNTNADAIIAVYPFTPQPLITEALIKAADVPIFCGVGGGITQGKRVVNLALDAEFKGAMGVVVNAPTDNRIVRKIHDTIDIPVIVTIVSDEDDVDGRIKSGATILNISAGRDTPRIVKMIREKYPEFPIMATGGPTDESIQRTIEAGANAITYTPPSGAEVMGALMDKYRGTNQ